MPLVLADRVRDTTTTTGTGTVTLSGTAPTGYQNFSVIGNGNTTYYTINAGSQWEVGIGTYSSTGPTLARTTVLKSSNANALVDFAAGVKDVFVTYPADEVVIQDGSTIQAGTSVLAVANGGTGVTTSTGTGSVVLSTSPTLTTPNLGTPSAATLTNATGLPIVAGTTGTLSVARGGTGQTSFTNGQLLIGNTTGNTLTPATLTAGSNISITNGAGSITIAATDQFTGTVTSVAQTFTGGLISVSGSPVTTSGTLALTVAGTSGGIPYFSSASTWATSGVLAANALVVGGGAGAAPATVTTGTGVVTALGVAVGSAGAFVVNGGALGTPSSGTVTNLTGTASININGTVGATTPNTGAFTSITSTSAAGILTRAAATQDGIELIGRAGGTTSLKVTLTPTTLTASRTVTFPDANINFTTGLPVANGGTGSTTAAGARTNLGATTVGGNFFTLANPTAITFPRINADNTVSTLDAATFRTAIGAGTGSGTVTSVALSGGTTGLTVSGSPITTSGTITLAGTLAVANGGTGVTTSTGTGSVVLSSSPTLVTPTLGAASATSIAAALGAVGTPSYTFTGDTNTGIYSPAADTLAFVEGGIEAMRIDSSGNVGIGTSSPGVRLDVAGGSIRVGNTHAMTFRNAAGTGTATFTLQSDDNFVIYNAAGTPIQSFTQGANSFAVYGGNSNNRMLVDSGSNIIYWNVNGSERVRIDSSGNVGIGTSAPSTRLTAAGVIRSTISGGTLDVSHDGTNGSLASSSQLLLYANGANNMIFHTNGSQRLIINSTGAITSSDLADAVGYKGIPQNAQTAAYTLALSDIGKHISITTGGVVIPANGTVAFPIGSAVTIYNNSASNQTISITTDTLRLAGTATTGSRTLAQRGICTCVKVAATEWVISGAGLT